jgi:hypothetical protein
MYKWSAGPTPAPSRPLDHPVWVDLVQLYGEPDPSAGPVADDPLPGGYLQVSGRVPGLLKRWAEPPTVVGSAGSISPDAYGAVQARHEGALVPAVALTPLVDGVQD